MKIEVGPSTLDNVKLETAVLRDFDNDDGDEMANWVEVCQENKYTHSSLDECAEGFTRAHIDADSDSSFVKEAFDDCVDCSCNKHSLNPCHPSSGICDCGHNTSGLLKNAYRRKLKKK